MKKSIENIFLVLLLFFVTSSFTIKKLGIEKGLSNNNINSIVQDRKGIMWFGTRSGMNRFDGDKFRVFKHSTIAENTISSNELNPAFADRFDNIIWIATEKDGVNAYNYTENKFTYFRNDPSTSNSISSNGVTGISDDASGNLWFATYNAGVDYYDKKKAVFTHYNQSTVKGLGSDYNWCAVDDRNGNLYIGHVFSGLSVVNLKSRTAKHYQLIPGDPFSIPDNRVNCILVDSKKRVWVGTNNGLALFNPKSEKFIVFRHNKYPNSLSGNVIRCITEINESSIWIGTSTGGVNILNYEDEIFTNPDKVNFDHIPVFDNPNGLSNAYIEAICQDTYGNIWIGTAGGGLNFIANNPDFFNRIDCLPFHGNSMSLTNKLVSGVCLDNENNLWVGTEEGGIDVFRNNVRINNFNRANSPVTNNIACALTDSEKNMWFGTVDGSVFCYNTKQKRFSELSGFKLNGVWIRSFYEDSKKNLWICTDLGLYSYNLATKLHRSFFIQENGLTDNVVRSITEDKNGNLWVGSLSGGLCVFTPDFKRIHYYPTGEHLYGINHIFKDTQNRIWIGTRSNLIVFKNATDTVFESFGLQDGFDDSYFHAITQGVSANDIWVSTTNGISYFNFGTRKVLNFNQMDGIPFGDYMNGAVTKSTDGIIYFGTQNGVCWFNSKAQFVSHQIPEVVVTGFAVVNKKFSYKGDLSEIPLQENIRLKYNENTFSVSYSVPDFSLNDKVEFSYQMRGLDDNWFNVKNNKELTFRNLRPGKYELNIKARLRNQEWSDKYSTLIIEIKPPFWFAWWAKLIYFIIVVYVAFYITRFYKRKLDLENSLYLEKKDHQQEQELNDERLRFFTNITHELRTPLTLIIGPLEDLVNDDSIQPAHLKKLSSIQRSARRLLDLINQILEFRKSETRNRRLSVRKADITELANDILLKYKELNQNQKIEFVVKMPKAPVEIYFDTEVITIILDNLISNAMKYTQEGKITLQIKNKTEDNNQLTEITVSDTGAGIAPEELARIFDRYYQIKGKHQVSGTGIGLSLVKNMVELHEGKILVKSTPGKGTSFTLQLNSDNNYPNAIHAQAEIERIEEMDQHIHEISNQLILIVEDNPEIQEYIHDCFSDSYEVLVADNGRTGLEIAFERIPDVIISDIMMPQMDGTELCKRLKADFRTSHIPVIMLTAKDSLKDKTEGYNAGADSYLTKPFSGSLLKSRVNNLLDSRKKMNELYSPLVMNKQSIVTESINKLDNEFMERLTKIIEENMEIEQLNIAQIADQMFMSHSTLYRKIKALTGLSANEFIRKVRMKNAEKLLLTRKFTIAEIIFKVGISTPAYFRQCFKEEFGVTPTEYLHNIKEGK